MPESLEIDRTVSASVGPINGRHGEAAWTPIRYVNRAYSRASLAGLFRSADIGLVTPLRDGMNLVAKEYVAAQDPEDPGVLVLSRFAGAAAELDVRRTDSGPPYGPGTGRAASASRGSSRPEACS